jgi:hypothetical protein
MNQHTKGHILQAQPIAQDRDLWLLSIRTIDRVGADNIRQHV